MGLDFDFSTRLKCIPGHGGASGDLILRLWGLHISNVSLRYERQHGVGHVYIRNLGEC